MISFGNSSQTQQERSINKRFRRFILQLYFFIEDQVHFQTSTCEYSRSSGIDLLEPSRNAKLFDVGSLTDAFV